MAAETQHDQAGIVLRWIGSYVGKIQIQGYENPALEPAGFGQIKTTTTYEPLITYRNRLVSACEKLSGQLYRKILVYLELHPLCYAGKLTKRSRARSAA